MSSEYLSILVYSFDTQNTKKIMYILFIYSDTKILRTHFWYSFDTQNTEKILGIICYENNLYLYTDVYALNTPRMKNTYIFNMRILYT